MQTLVKTVEVDILHTFFRFKLLATTSMICDIATWHPVVFALKLYLGS